MRRGGSGEGRPGGKAKWGGGGVKRGGADGEGEGGRGAITLQLLYPTWGLHPTIIDHHMV